MADRLRQKELMEPVDRWEPNNKVLMSLLEGDKSNLSVMDVRRLIRLGYIDNDGNINKK